MSTTKTFKNHVILLIAVTTIIRIIIAHYTGLGIGESYYFGGVTHPSLSYFDQPPLFFWLSKVSTYIFGMGPLALRLPSILLFAASTWLLYLIGKKLFSEKAAFYSAVILNLSFVFTIPTAVWLQPDASLIFFWLACIYFLVQVFFIQSQNIRKTRFLWVMVGITLGLAALSKYHAVFIVVATFLFLVFNKEYRHWLRHPGPYIALTLCLLMSLPVIIWNSHNNWASFFFQGSRAGTDLFRFHFDWFIRSIAGQALWIAPWIWWPSLQQLYQSFQNTDNYPTYNFLFWLAFLPIAFFTSITLWTNTAFHFHWQAPGYIILFLFLGNFVVEKENESPKMKKVWQGWWSFSIFFLIGFSAIALLYTETGFLKHKGPRWFTQKFVQLYDPTIEGYDFDDIATRFDSEGWTNNDSIFVGCDKWWIAGKIDWPLRGQKPVLIFSNDPRNYAYFDNPNHLLGKNAILLSKNGEELLANAQHYFESIEQLPDIHIYRGGIKEFSFKVYLGRKFKKPEIPRPDMPVYRQLVGIKAY